MNILHLMAGLGEASGVANMARRFARVQSERGDAVALLAPSFKWNPIYFGFVFSIRAWRRACAADEIWVHCSWTFPVWFGAWLAKRMGKRLVVVPGGSFDPKRIHNRAEWKKRLVAPLDRRVLRQADEVLALCPDERQWIVSFEPLAKACLAKVPIFVQEKTGTQGQRSGKLELYRAEGSPLHVLFLGRAEDPLKGVRYLERAVADLNVEASRTPMGKARCAVELRVESHVFGTAKEAVWAWCDVLVLPTLSENFGLVIAEALERGKFVITTDGAPAWAGLEPWQGIYIKGFRNGSENERIALLKNAIARGLACSVRSANRPEMPTGDC